MSDEILLIIWRNAVLSAPAGSPGNGGEGQAPPGLFDPSFVLILLAMFGVMYFLVIMPQRRREKERQELLQNIQKGDRVITTGGVFGTVIKLSTQKVVLKVNDAPGGELTFLREAIARVVQKKGEKAADEDDAADVEEAASS